VRVRTSERAALFEPVELKEWPERATAETGGPSVPHPSATQTRLSLALKEASAGQWQARPDC
jgi:hypothetical protein